MLLSLLAKSFRRKRDFFVVEKRSMKKISRRRRKICFSRNSFCAFLVFGEKEFSSSPSFFFIHNKRFSRPFSTHCFHLRCSSLSGLSSHDWKLIRMSVIQWNLWRTYFNELFINFLFFPRIVVAFHSELFSTINFRLDVDEFFIFVFYAMTQINFISFALTFRSFFIGSFISHECKLKLFFMYVIVTRM